jgi:hypothetical protein
MTRSTGHHIGCRFLMLTGLFFYQSLIEFFPADFDVKIFITIMIAIEIRAGSIRL